MVIPVLMRMCEGFVMTAEVLQQLQIAEMNDVMG
jgi:hypothetical protein